MGLNTGIIGVRRKSVYDELSDAKAVLQACYAMRAIGIPLPIFHGGKFLGHVMGNYITKTSKWISPRIASTPFSDYDTAINTITNSRKANLISWAKSLAAPTIDNWYDLWPVFPGAGAYGGSARTANQFIKTTTGALWGGGAPGTTKYLTRFSATSNAGVPKAFILYDRVLTYEACTVTSGNQTMTNTLTAQRYISTGDPGLQMSLTSQTTSNATAANLTQLRYTDNAGNTLVSVPTTPTITKIVSVAAPTTTLGARVIAPQGGTAGKCDTPFLPLATGTLGARLINDYTWSGGPTGTFCAVLLYPLAIIPEICTAGQASDFEYISGTQSMRSLKIYDDACLNLYMMESRVSAANISFGHYEITWT